MFQSFRPTLETLERREVFSTAADLVPVVQAATDPVPTEQISLNFADVAGVADGDFNGDGTLDLASMSFAGDGIGLHNLLPSIEQGNVYKFQGGCSGNNDLVDAVYRDLAGQDAVLLLPYLDQDNLYKQASFWVDAATEAERQQIIAILIGLLQKSGSETERMSDITDGTNNTRAGGEVVSGEFVRIADVTDGTSNTLLGAFRDATPDQRTQIIAILIG
jgi:hypothetical protein